MIMHHARAHRPSASGFTLVELLVSIGIMIFITATILFNYRKFDSDVTLADIAFDVALSVRNAQSYGIGVSGVGSGFNFPYGVHFESVSNTYLLYYDTSSESGNTKWVYNSDAGDSVVETYTLNRKYQIEEVCVGNGIITDADGVVRIDPAQSPVCGPADIAFQRPNPDALIVASDAAQSEPTKYNYAVIIVKSVPSPSSKKSIVISATGQISVP